MKNVLALLGDSSFDNGVYVGRAPPVLHQVRAELGDAWEVMQGAFDGDVTDEVVGQLGKCEGATHLAVSVGGNDALGKSGVLEERAGHVGTALIRMGDAVAEFRTRYGRMLDALLEHTPNVVACTIYEPNFPEPLRQRAACAGLVFFDDVILRAAFARGVPVIELRAVCSAPGDLANPIEPSAQGGAKIAKALARVLREHDFAARRSAVFTE